MFVSDSGLHAQFFPLQLIVGICSQDVLSLVELAGKVCIGLHDSFVIFPVIFAVTGIEAVDIFQTGIHIMHVADGIHIVYLSGMFCRVGIVVIILAA